ncbi:uncharacterized protein LOC130629386 [Hydractinia symbiolongicarpus]|uniref:uncharacterized protein LOC130628462 n=1 Tax=Hydractinia symbiolongicarpus TaxID=13093 RepID=UPI00254EB2F0|nr:uncharacterized protein LOC130628462 [Hydractinia symbiolongicarpus]XP_057298532.1 uncharacterized protein LOC130629386 [Hydractinia symbiolongicarpus]
MELNKNESTFNLDGDTNVVDVLLQTFGVKGLKAGHDVACNFAAWKLSELKLFLKISGKLKGLTNAKKQKVLETVILTWKKLNYIQLSSTMTVKENQDDTDAAAPSAAILLSPIRKPIPGVTASTPRDPTLRYPDIKEGMCKADFETWTMSHLQEFLGDRNINRTGNKCRLVENAFAAYKLNLAVSATNIQEEKEQIKRDVSAKLLLENGLMRLPDPTTLKNDWVEAPINLPDTLNNNVTEYLEKNNAGKAFKGGNSLLQSGHVSNVMTHMISPNIRYCFVRGSCLPEQKLSKDPYSVWVCLHKDFGDVITGDCSCTAGVSGVCKHVGGLLWYIEREVRLGHNQTCTSKKQQWSVPSKKQLKLHVPDILNNITIKKPKAEKILSPNESYGQNRFHYDPRHVNDRSTDLLYEKDINALADVTNGNCGIVQLMRKRCHHDNADGEIISNVVEISETEHVETPMTVQQNFEKVGTTSFENFTSHLKISPAQQLLVQELTSNQSKDVSWFEYRRDRVTASKFKDCCIKVDNNFDIINPKKTRTLISKVCGYYDSKYQSKACRWGINNEPVARKIYEKNMKKSHRHFKVMEPGFFIDMAYPFIGASPDGLVSCSCHDPGLLEIKCPWTHRGLNIPEYASKKDSCLEIVGVDIKLKRKHTYFYQMQCQMHATGRNWCDFFLCTTKDSFVERIMFDKEFYDMAVRKATVVYKELILPEIYTRDLCYTLHVEKEVKETVADIVDHVTIALSNTS